MAVKRSRLTPEELAGRRARDAQRRERDRRQIEVAKALEREQGLDPAIIEVRDLVDPTRALWQQPTLRAMKFRDLVKDGTITPELLRHYRKAMRAENWKRIRGR